MSKSYVSRTSVVNHESEVKTTEYVWKPFNNETYIRAAQGRITELYHHMLFGNTFNPNEPFSPYIPENTRDFSVVKLQLKSNATFESLLEAKEGITHIWGRTIVRINGQFFHFTLKTRFVPVRNKACMTAYNNGLYKLNVYTSNAGFTLYTDLYNVDPNDKRYVTYCTQCKQYTRYEHKECDNAPLASSTPAYVVKPYFSQFMRGLFTPLSLHVYVHDVAKYYEMLGREWYHEEKDGPFQLRNSYCVMKMFEHTDMKYWPIADKVVTSYLAKNGMAAFESWMADIDTWKNEEEWEKNITQLKA